MDSSFPYALIILDRDGVINHDSDEYIKGPEEWHPIEGSLEAIAQLNQIGIKVALASNQAGIARGKFTQEDFEQTHQKMLSALHKKGAHLDYIAYCFDGPDSGSPRRKPAPGMLFEISKALEIPLNKALFVGDSYTDYEAALAASCDFTLVLTGKGRRTLDKHPELADEQAVYPALSSLIKALNAQSA